MQKKELIYEGKAKKVYATDDPELLIVDYKDDATAFNGLKKGTIRGKGIINNRMSNRLMQRLERAGIPTHFVKETCPDRSAGGDRPQHRRRLLLQAVRRAGRNGLRRADHRVFL